MGAKLIRSKLPDTQWEDPELKKFIRACHSPEERAELLTQKLFEEMGEFVAALASGDRSEIAGEGGDVIDVIRALAFDRGVHPDVLETTRLNKGAEFGTFIDSNYVWEM